MAPRLLLAIFDSIYLFALASWIGAVLFFWFCVTPVAFRVLGQASGDRFVRALYPRYYAWGVVSGSIALPAFLGGPLSFPEYKGLWAGAQAFLILSGILIFLYCGNTLTPALNAAHDPGRQSGERLDRLQHRSIILNAVVLVVGIVLLVAQANRRSPQTEGIVERMPVLSSPSR